MKTLPILCSGIVLLSGWIGYAKFYSSLTPDAITIVPPEHLPYDSSAIDQTVANCQIAVKGDPKGALGWSFLASAYLERSRESDDTAAAMQAEQAARMSLSLRKLGNVTAWDKVVQSLLQQHKFKEALHECENIKKANMQDDIARRLHVECSIETGDITKAQLLLEQDRKAFQDASGATVVARLLDLTGKPDQALQLLRKSAREADLSSGTPSNAIAWFHVRLGQQLARMGKSDEAQSEFTQALTLYPRDYRALNGLAKLSSQKKMFFHAIEFAKKADEIAPMVEGRTLIGDCLVAQNQTKEAGLWYKKATELVSKPGGFTNGIHEISAAALTHGHSLDRQYARYCADHDFDLDGAYAAAIRDFGSRSDIYAFDTLAWVCLKRGLVDEAKLGIEKALALGTFDAQLFYHAGEIYAAVGDTAKAETYLTKALNLDPQFDVLAADKARSDLAELRLAKTNAHS